MKYLTTVRTALGKLAHFLNKSRVFRKAITVKQKVMGGYRMPVPEKMPESLAAVMEKCWDHDPTKRPKAAEVFKELNSINQVRWTCSRFIPILGV